MHREMREGDVPRKKQKVFGGKETKARETENERQQTRNKKWETENERQKKHS